jgi:hypothetical protein
MGEPGDKGSRKIRRRCLPGLELESGISCRKNVLRSGDSEGTLPNHVISSFECEAFLSKLTVLSVKLSSIIRSFHEPLRARIEPSDSPCALTSRATVFGTGRPVIFSSETAYVIDK